MGRIQAESNVGGAKDAKELAGYCESWFTQAAGQIHGNLEFDKNILSQTVSVTFPAAANTEMLIQHSLGKIIADYIVCKKSVACDVYDGTSASTNNTIYLKCTVANAVVKIILKGS